MKKLFTERHSLSEPRTRETLDVELTKSLLAIVSSKIDENLFGEAFPDECPDGRSTNIGCDVEKLKASLSAYRVVWPGDWPKQNVQWPTDPEVFDLLEFLYEHAALPSSYQYHSYFQHDHFNYDRDKGREKFEQEINRFFERNGLAFELAHGEVTRLAPSGLQELLASPAFKTGDGDLDRLLETSREKIMNREIDVRREALEKLWDAWERLKTIEQGNDKKAQTKTLLDKASTEPVLRERLEIEARELTTIGNTLMIRHSEVGKPAVEQSPQVDYLFHRMFAMILLVLKGAGRVAG